MAVIEELEWTGDRWAPFRFGAIASIIEEFTYGTTQLTRQNTGVTSTPRSRYEGDIYMDTPGMKIKDLDVFGRVIPRAANCSAENVAAFGHPQGTYATSSDSGTALFMCASTNCTGFVATRCDAVPSVPTSKLNGFLGGGFTADRVYVKDTADGFGMTRSNTLLKGVFVESLAYFYPSAQGRSDGNHADAIQFSGGSNHRVLGSLLRGYKSPGVGQAGTPQDYYYPNMRTTSCVMFTPDAAAISDVRIDKSWLFGGGVTVNLLDQNGRGPITGVVIDGNRFGGDGTFDLDIAAAASTFDAMTITNNLRADGSAIKTQRKV